MDEAESHRVAVAKFMQRVRPCDATFLSWVLAHFLQVRELVMLRFRIASHQKTLPEMVFEDAVPNIGYAFPCTCLPTFHDTYFPIELSFRTCWRSPNLVVHWNPSARNAKRSLRRISKQWMSRFSSTSYEHSAFPFAQIQPGSLKLIALHPHDFISLQHSVCGRWHTEYGRHC